MSRTVIYHNPNCETSRNTLALIRNSREEPKIILYLETPPERSELADLIVAMGIQHPILINRPIVKTPLGTRLCSPSEVVLELLKNPQKEPFSKEDGEVVINCHGQRAS